MDMLWYHLNWEKVYHLYQNPNAPVTKSLKPVRIILHYYKKMIISKTIIIGGIPYGHIINEY